MNNAYLCNQCNTPNSPGANFCKSCGKPMDQPTNPQNNVNPSPPLYAGYSNPNNVQQVNYHEFPKYQKSILSYSSYTIIIRVLVLFIVVFFALVVVPSLEEDSDLSQSFTLFQMDTLIRTALYSICVIIGMIYVKKNYEKFTPESYTHMKYLHLFILVTTVLSFFVNTPGGGLWDLFLSGYCYHKLRINEFRYWYLSQGSIE